MIELYINDTLMDLSENMGFDRIYQSSIFGDISEIQGNGTTTIKLPRTFNNLKAIDFSHRDDIDTDFPYQIHSARMYEDGIPVFENGISYLDKVGDTIDVVFVWGVIENFDALSKQKLNELPGETSLSWNSDTPYVTNAAAKYGFWDINFGLGNVRTDRIQGQHPCVKSSWILDRIEAVHRITIDRSKFPVDYIVPLISKRANAASWTAQGLKGTLRAVQGVDFLTYYLRPSIYTQSSIIWDTSKNRYLINRSPFTFKLKCAINGSNDTTDNPRMTMFLNNEEGEGGRKNYSYTQRAGNVFFFDIEDEINEDFDFMRLDATQCSGLNSSYETNIEITPRPDEVLFPSKFPIELNLPEITCTAFLKTLMQLNGVFACLDYENSNSIKFLSIDEIYDNIPNALDWSNKLIVNEDIASPDITEYKIEDFAQRNILDWDNDDDITADTSGSINVANANLEDEKEMVTLPFSATRNNTIPIYSLKQRSPEDPTGVDEFEYSKVTPRILTLNSAGQPIFPYTMYFSNIVAEKYSKFQQTLIKARAIEVRMNLSPLDLYPLRYELPIYLR